MKKFILIYCCLTFTASVALSQNAFQRKDLFINAGLSLINYRNVEYDASERAGKSLPIFVSAEYGFSNLVSVGPFAGYYSRGYNYRGSMETTEDDLFFKSRFITLGIKTSFHLSPFLENKWKGDLYSEDLDLYGTVLLGYEINRISQVNYFNYQSKLVAGASLGARYFINYRMAVFAEVGPGILGLASIGATARF
jgi:hypothetical protein